jgi:hypothetical protein
VLVAPAGASEGEGQGSRSRRWIIGGTIAAAAVVAVAAIVFVTRDGPAFDGPGVTLTPGTPQ